MFKFCSKLKIMMLRFSWISRFFFRILVFISLWYEFTNTQKIQMSVDKCILIWSPPIIVFGILLFEFFKKKFANAKMTIFCCVM